MIDPLTGFAVAGNALQFADLLVKLISKTCSIYRSTDGLEDEYTYLRTTAQNVRNCNLLLDEFSKDLSAQQGHAAQALLDANNACLAVTTEVVSFIEKVAPPNTSNRLLGSAKSALRRLRNQKRCDRLEHKIADARSNVSMALLTYTTMQATASQKILSEAIMTSTTQITHHLKTEYTRLHGRIDGVESLTKSLSAMSMRAIEPLVGLQNRVPIRRRVGNLDRLLRSGERILLASLHSSQMDARRDQIRRIHPGTMQWVFSRQADTHHLWHEFAEWLEACDGERIYWIRGKPGSGKSTLMRNLEKQIQQHHLGGWMADQQVVVASSYFWHASSSPIQRSMEGLLRSVLFQLLGKLPDLLPEVMTADRWEDAIFAKSGSSTSKLWTVEQLKAAFYRIIELTSSHSDCPKNILLQVDGMDELDGTDEDRNEMLELFTIITSEPHVKVCVSSRPWTTFTRRLQSSPQLRVEDLNKGDIQLYVHDHLAGDADFREMSSHYPTLEDSIQDEITRKASGVFLWVYLVVRDLLKVVRDGGSESLLHRTLSDIPSDMNSYYTRMLGSIDLKYHKTMHDFLLMPPAQNLLHKETNRVFPA